MLDACFRCDLISAKWRGISPFLISWLCSVITAPGAVGHSSCQDSLPEWTPLRLHQNRQGVLRKPAPQAARPQPRSLSEVIWLCLSLLNCTIFLKVWVKGVTMFGTIPSHTHDWESDKLAWTRRTSTILLSAFLPLGKSCHLSVLMMSSKKAFGIYWYIYSPWQSTHGVVYQQHLIPFSWNTEEEGLNPDRDWTQVSTCRVIYEQLFNK